MRKQTIALCLALSLSLTACETNSNGKMSFSGMSAGNNGESIVDYCHEYPAGCIAAGLLIVGGVVLVASHHDHHDIAAPVLISDERLKQDIRPLMTLPDGIRLYTYRYRNDSRVFAGAMAQDLLNDPRYREAVSIDASGYYEVDYGRLGLTLVNTSAMRDAAARALAASPL